MLKTLKELMDKLEKTNSTINKKEILESYPQLVKILEYIYSPFIKFYITSDNLKKRKDLIEKNDYNLFTILLKISKREITGHAAIALVNGFIEKNKEFEDIIYKIIDKNLKVGLDAKLINKVFPDSIPMFEVQLADKYVEGKIDFNTEHYIAQKKLDGCRTITIIHNDEITFLSRTGKEFTTLDTLKNDIRKYFSNFNDVVIDGECCIVDEKGNEDFSSIMKEITRKNHTILKPKYFIFDFLPLINFEKGKYVLNYIDRLDCLPDVGDNLEILKYWKITSNKGFEELKQMSINKLWEGLILRKENAPYEGKRSKNLLKVKQFMDEEYKVEDVYFTKKGMLNEKGLNEEVDCLGGVYINHKGYKVGVGSGWSDEERVRYFKHPEEIIGKILTVKYFAETTNNDGTISLRFPTKKCIYEGEREI